MFRTAQGDRVSVVIGVLADASAARALFRSWLAAGCPATRLYLFAGVDVVLDAATLGAPDGTLDGAPDESLDGAPPAGPPLPLVRLARHGPLVIWALETPAHERCRSARRGRRARRALTLFGRLAAAGTASGWAAHARALAAGRPLGVARLARTEADPARLVRPLLAHAAVPVRVCDLVHA